MFWIHKEFLFLFINNHFLNLALILDQILQILHPVTVKVRANWKSAQSRRDVLAARNEYHRFSLGAFSTEHQHLYLKIPWKTVSVKSSAVISSSEGAMGMNWTSSPTLSWQTATQGHAEPIQTVAELPVKRVLPWASGVELARPDSALPEACAAAQAFPCLQF